MQANTGYSPKMLAAKEPASLVGKVMSSGVSNASTSAACSPDLSFVGMPDIELSGLLEDTSSPSTKTEMTMEAMALLLPGLKRMRRDATSLEEKRKLTEEIDEIEKKLGVASACPEPNKCVVSRSVDRADESVEGRRGRTTSGGDATELAVNKSYAAIMLPGLQRMRQSAPMEERARLNREIAELERTLGVCSNPADVMKVAVSRREDRADVSDGSKGEASSDACASQKLNAALIEAGQSSEMSPEIMALLLPGLKRMHRDARTIEERSQLTEEIKAMEVSLRLAGVDSSLRRDAWAAGVENEAEISQEFANLMLPGLRRMRQSASSEDRTRLNQEIIQLEDHLGVASSTVETAKCVVSRREDRE